jgi:glutaredoxin
MPRMALLQERSIPYERIDLGHGFTMISVRAASGAAKPPQVFIAGRLIGGSDALKTYLDERAPDKR